MLIAFSFVPLLYFLLRHSAAAFTASSEKPGVVIRTYTIPSIPKPQLPKTQTTTVLKPAMTKAFTPPRFVNYDVPPVADNKSLLTVSIGSTDIEAPAVSGNNSLPVPTNTGNGLPTEAPVKKEAPIQRQPEFPGGIKAWLEFLQNNLHTPTGLDAGEKRTVLVNFFVDEEGQVTNFKVLQSGGKDFDNEVIRVLRKMPRWKPAIQNGQPVAISFSQPVTFIGVEE